MENPASIDSSVLERSKNVTVMPGKFGWDDVGTWDALGRVRDKDEFGNVTHGDVHLLDGCDNVVHTDSGRVGKQPRQERRQGRRLLCPPDERERGAEQQAGGARVGAVVDARRI